MRHVAETTGSNLEVRVRISVTAGSSCTALLSSEIGMYPHAQTLQEMYKKIGWPLYRIYGHAFDAMKTMVADDGAGIFKRLEEENGGPLEVLTPEVCDDSVRMEKGQGLTEVARMKEQQQRLQHSIRI